MGWKNLQEELDEEFSELSGSVMDSMLAAYRRKLDQAAWRQRAERRMVDAGGQLPPAQRPKAVQDRMAAKNARLRQRRADGRDPTKPRRSWKLTPEQREWARTCGLGVVETGRVLGIHPGSVSNLRNGRAPAGSPRKNKRNWTPEQLAILNGPLPVRKAAALLGVAHGTVFYYRRRVQVDSVPTMVT